IQTLDITSIGFCNFLVERFEFFNVVIPIEYCVAYVWIDHSREHLTQATCNNEPEGIIFFIIVSLLDKLHHRSQKPIFISPYHYVQSFISLLSQFLDTADY